MTSTKTLMIQALKTAIEPILRKYGGGGFAGWNGQPQEQERNNAFQYPAVFWELIEIPWRSHGYDKGGHIQYTKDALIDFHLCVHSVGDDPHLDTDLFEIADELSAEIGKVNGDNFGSFYRESERQDVQHEQVVDYVISFRFGIADTTTFTPETEQVNLSTLEINTTTS